MLVHIVQFSVAVVWSGLIWSSPVLVPQKIGPIQDWTGVWLVCAVWTPQTTKYAYFGKSETGL